MGFSAESLNSSELLRIFGLAPEPWLSGNADDLITCGGLRIADFTKI